jgi:Asp-tRNAAsn/Glu-tRNAGln amidotransferase A subunit and related amidases
MQRKVILRRISTYPFSMANVPAIAVPAGFTQAGLPVSLQIAAKPFDEATVFRVAHAFERATAWHTRHPDLTKLAPAAVQGCRP